MISILFFLLVLERGLNAAYVYPLAAHNTMQSM